MKEGRQCYGGEKIAEAGGGKAGHHRPIFNVGKEGYIREG